MTPENYLGVTTSPTLCYIGIMEEKTGKTDFWLLGDNFLRGYYQVYDISNKQMGLASSKFITNGSYFFNNSVVYVPSRETTSGLGTGENEKILGMDQMDFTIMIIVVCGGGSLILIGIGICAYCWVKKRKQRAAPGRQATNIQRNNPRNQNNIRRVSPR
jgi:hypothetical protein